MTDAMISTLPDADMQAAPKALLRAAQRARDIARQTNTRLVLVRAGELVEEVVTDSPSAALEARNVP
jgi:2-keto-3-deoxy-galactonokinase